jgi:tight adherence protein B
VIVVSLGACVTFIVWFVRRARLGARTREAAGVRTRFVDRIVADGLLWRAGAGALAGFFIGGAPFAAAGAVAGTASKRLLAARSARREQRALAEQLPDLMRALASGVRAGRSVPQALDAAAEDAPQPIKTALDAATGLLRVGAPLDEALDAFAARIGSTDAALVVETILIGRAAGSNLPAILEVAVESLAERERIARDRNAAAAQAKMSAVVVGAMPIAFFALIGSGARDQVHVLFGDPIGWGLLAGGLILETGGALWMRALLRPR